MLSQIERAAMLAEAKEWGAEIRRTLALPQWLPESTSVYLPLEPRVRRLERAAVAGNLQKTLEDLDTRIIYRFLADPAMEGVWHSVGNSVPNQAIHYFCLYGLCAISKTAIAPLHPGHARQDIVQPLAKSASAILQILDENCPSDRSLKMERIGGINDRESILFGATGNRANLETLRSLLATVVRNCSNLNIKNLIGSTKLPPPSRKLLAAPRGRQDYFAEIMTKFFEDYSGQPHDKIAAEATNIVFGLSATIVNSLEDSVPLEPLTAQSVKDRRNKRRNQKKRAIPFKAKTSSECDPD